MPKPNAFIQVAKRLASLEAKSIKMNEEIKALIALVEIESKKQEQAPAPAAKPAAKPVAKAAPKPAPKASAKPAPKPAAKPAPVAGKAGAPADSAKKRGRPTKK